MTSGPDTAPFSPVSVAKLATAGLDVDYAVSVGVVPVTSSADLPEELAGNPYAEPTPGMLFPWHAGDGEIVWQYRPDDPVVNDAGDTVKYVFPTGAYQNFARVRDASAPGGARVSLVVEGTLQSLAAARYAEPDVAVYAIPGCWGWSEQQVPTADLAALSGTDVVISLDADAATNRAVYDAGVRLTDAVATMAGTTPRFTRLGAGGSTGLDDLLGQLPADRRGPVVANLISGAKPRPADNKDSLQSRSSSVDFSALAADMPVAAADDTAQASAWVQASKGLHRFLLRNGWRSYRAGRWDDVADETVGASIGDVLYEQGDLYQSLSKQASNRDEQRDLKAIASTLWSNNKISSVMGRASRMPGLHLDVDAMDRHPHLWCAANAVIDLGTGQAAEHDPELLMSRGSHVAYDPDADCPDFDYFMADVLPDEDVREFVLQCFAMAMSGEVTDHVLPVFLGPKRNGKSTILRIMTALFGDYATVVPEELIVESGRVNAGDMEKLTVELFGRRLATFEETRQSSPWNVDKIKSLTGGNRMRGRQLYKTPFTFDPSHTIVMATNHQPRVKGSSEEAFWARYAEVPFRVALQGREDPTLEKRIMDDQLPGVLNRLLAAGARYRSAGRLRAPQAVTAATESSRVEESPFEQFAAAKLERTDRYEDRLPVDDVHAELVKWWTDNVDSARPPAKNKSTPEIQRALGFPLNRDVAEKDQNPRLMWVGETRRRAWIGLVWNDDEDRPKINPLPPANCSTTDDTEEGDPYPSESTDLGRQQSDPPAVNSSSSVVVDQASLVFAGHSYPVISVISIISSLEKCSSGGRGGGNTQVTGEYEGPLWEEENKGKSTDDCEQATVATTAPAPSGPPVVFDLETGSADQLHDVADPRSYVRIAGVRAHGATVVYAGPDAVIDHVLSSRRVIGHNIVHFDLPALARVDDRIDLLGMARAGRLHDTMITESVLHPILNDKRPNAVGRAQKHFGLDAVAARRGLAGKTDEIARLAAEHGGFDQVPLDDPEYRSYCAGDTEATHQLAGHQALEIARLPQLQRDYIAREHRVHAIAATMSRAGFAVDQTLLQRRFWAAYGRKNDLSRSLIAEYGIPTLKADGKPADSPAATKGGKEALLRAFHGLGVALSDIPKTSKGKASFGKDAMAELAELYAEAPNAEAIAALAEMCTDVAGVRSVYGTILQHLHPDGRVHPSVATYQASGRWSVRDPGLTVLGKRGGKVIERAVLTATDAEHALFAIDLSQIDSRAIAVHSQDHAYLDLFEPGQDAHEIVARMVWGDAAYDATPKILRERVKAITHGLPYGMGLPKLVATTKVPEAEAQRVVDTMNTRFPRLQEWKEEVREQAASGSGLDNGFGRIMLADPERAYTQGPALAGQGTARDLMMECLLRLPDEIAAMLRAQVHDEAVFEVPRARAGEIIEVVNAAFTYDWCPPGASRPVQVIGEAGRLASSWTGCY